MNIVMLRPPSLLLALFPPWGCSLMAEILVPGASVCCRCLGQEFLPFMNIVMPPLMQSAALKPDVTIKDIDEDNPDDDDDDDGGYADNACSLSICSGGPLVCKGLHLSCRLRLGALSLG